VACLSGRAPARSAPNAFSSVAGVVPNVGWLEGVGSGVREGRNRETRGPQRSRGMGNRGEASGAMGRSVGWTPRGDETREAHRVGGMAGLRGDKPRRSLRRYEDSPSVLCNKATLGRHGAVVLFVGQHLTISNSAARVASPLQ
jgi:hypothetical protein